MVISVAERILVTNGIYYLGDVEHLTHIKCIKPPSCVLPKLGVWPQPAKPAE